MAGRITVSTINDDTGVLATQNGMTGIAKAWVNFAGATGTIAGSFNVSSITRNSTGDWTVNFTTAMPNSNYSANASGCAVIDGASSYPVMVYEYMSAGPTLVRTTSSFRFLGVTFTGAYADGPSMNVTVNGA